MRDTTTNSSGEPSRLPRSAAGLSFGCAQTLDQVLAAWHLTYTAYRRRELIAANRHQLYLSQSAVGMQSVVLLGRIGPVTVSTLTATVEGPGNLPADRGFGGELRSVRRPGRRIMEMHLFADRRDDPRRSLDAFVHLLALGWAFGAMHEATDCLIAVEPEHAAVVTQAFGFDRLSEPHLYNGLIMRPMVMLRCDIAAAPTRENAPSGLRYLLSQRPTSDVFDRRYRFDPAEVAASAIGDYLREKYAIRSAG